MKNFLKDFVSRSRAKATVYRRRALHQAAAEMKFRERNREGSVWRSGKGGFHHDR